MMTISLANDGLATCVALAANALASGRLVVGPTDTLYGLFAPWGDAAAIESLYALKGRDQEKKLLALVADAGMAARHSAAAIPETLLAHWPGPLTIVVPASNHPLGWPTIALRQPANKFCLALAACLGQPFYAPSANPQGQPPALTVEEARACFGEAVGVYVDGGAVLDSRPSTLVSVVDGDIKILRAGALEL